MRYLVLFLLLFWAGLVQAQTPAVLQYGKLDSTTYISAALAAATYDPIIVASNTAKYYFNGYKKIVALSSDSLLLGTTNLFSQFTNITGGVAYNSGSLNIGTSTNISSALLNLTSTTAGMLTPRLSTTQMNAIPTPSTGLILYNTDSANFCLYTTKWNKLLASNSNNLDRISIDANGSINQKSTNGTVNVLNSTGAATTSDRCINIGSNTVGGVVTIGIGNGATVSGTGGVAIGYNASASYGLAISLGGNSATSTGGIAIGSNSSSSSGVSLGGTTKTSNGGNAAIGSNATASAQGATAIGASPYASANRAIAIGDQDTVTNTYSIAMGFAARSSASNQFVVGGYNGAAGNGYSITDMYLGSGVAGDGYNTKSGDNASINASGSFGTNQTGGNLTLAGGKGTGTGNGGDVILSTATTGTTGTTLQTLSPRWYIKSSTGQLSNVSTPSTSALVNLTSTTQGFLAPVMTTTQKLAITSPATGLQVYDTNMGCICYYNGTAWVNQPTISTGTAAPTTTPTKIGDEFVDTTNKKIYFATGTSASTDWTIVN